MHVTIDTLLQIFAILIAIIFGVFGLVKYRDGYMIKNVNNKDGTQTITQGNNNIIITRNNDAKLGEINQTMNKTAEYYINHYNSRRVELHYENKNVLYQGFYYISELSKMILEGGYEKNKAILVELAYISLQRDLYDTKGLPLFLKEEGKTILDIQYIVEAYQIVIGKELDVSLIERDDSCEMIL